MLTLIHVAPLSVVDVDDPDDDDDAAVAAPCTQIYSKRDDLRSSKVDTLSSLFSIFHCVFDI